MCPKKTSKRKWLLLPLITLLLTGAAIGLEIYFFKKQRRANPEKKASEALKHQVELFVESENTSKVDLEFNHLRYEIRSGEKTRQLIQDVSGSFKHGRVCSLLIFIYYRPFQFADSRV